MAPVLANPVRKDGSDALERLCVEDPQTGRWAFDVNWSGQGAAVVGVQHVACDRM